MALTAACEALPAEDARPDVIVVDEAQDFEQCDWMLVEQLAGKRDLWVFRDTRQAFWTDRPLPEALAATLGGRFVLPTSYRCPASLSPFAESYVSGVLPNTRPPEQVLKLVTCEDDQVLERTRHEVEALLRQGARPEQIVILSLSGQTRSKLFGLTKLGSTTLTHADSPEAGRSVVVETFLRFKGLERPFVVVTELGGTHVTHYETRMHIALTRATVQAVVVAAQADVGADPRLQLPVG